MDCKVNHRRLQFKQASGTSRGILKEKDSWYISLSRDGNTGIGECSTIVGLSPDIESGLEQKLEELANATGELRLSDPLFDGVPAMRFAYEMALLDLNSGGKKALFNSDFIRGKGIPINGLVWMGERQFMYDQIRAKIEEGFRCIKIKIAAIDFDAELSLLKYIRSQFSASDMEIRVDANGGFSNHDALEKLKRLSDYGLHSIEQPIKQGQYEEMARLCTETPLDIALDEELIGIMEQADMQKLLQIIAPQYIILKPSLVGGFAKAKQWIDMADSDNIGWWVTSALESNIGLNAIAQWTASLDSTMYQGLGTGQLFTNNITSPLYINNGHLYYGNEQWGKVFN